VDTQVTTGTPAIVGTQVITGTLGTVDTSATVGITAIADTVAITLAIGTVITGTLAIGAIRGTALDTDRSGRRTRTMHRESMLVSAGTVRVTIRRIMDLTPRIRIALRTGSAVIR
jgi:hypothetical protein